MDSFICSFWPARDGSLYLCTFWPTHDGPRYLGISVCSLYLHHVCMQNSARRKLARSSKMYLNWTSSFIKQTLLPVTFCLCVCYLFCVYLSLLARLPQEISMLKVSHRPGTKPLDWLWMMPSTAGYCGHCLVLFPVSIGKFWPNQKKGDMERSPITNYFS